MPTPPSSQPKEKTNHPTFKSKSKRSNQFPLSIHHNIKKRKAVVVHKKMKAMHIRPMPTTPTPTTSYARLSTHPLHHSHQSILLLLLLFFSFFSVTKQCQRSQLLTPFMKPTHPELSQPLLPLAMILPLSLLTVSEFLSP